MPTIAPEIFRKNLLIEGYYTIEVNEQTLPSYFLFLGKGLEEPPPFEPMISRAWVPEAAANYQACILLKHSGVCVTIWDHTKFLSAVIFSGKDFKMSRAIQLTREFFEITHSEHQQF